MRFDFAIAPRAVRGRAGALHPGTSALFDPSDASSLFQDVAGTIPVVAEGDPVALMRDLSGGGHHAMQPDPARRPVLEHVGGARGLKFNGVQFMELAAASIGGTSLFPGPGEAFTACMAVAGGQGVYLARGGGALSDRSLQLWRTNDRAFVCFGGAPIRSFADVDVPAVLTATWDGAQARTWPGGETEAVGDAVSDPGQRIIIGAHSNGTGYRFSGHIFGLTIINHALDEAARLSLEDWMRAKLP